jgi:hypothetical protein
MKKFSLDNLKLTPPDSPSSSSAHIITQNRLNIKVTFAKFRFDVYTVFFSIWATQNTPPHSPVERDT